MKFGGIFHSMTIPARLLWQKFKRRGDVQIQLLSRPGCHLCDEAEVALQREFGAGNIEVVNILEHRALEDEFVFRIPVVLHAGDVIAEGIIGRHEARLARQKAARRERNTQST